MREKILIVDDNRDAISILTATLKKEGYSVVVAKNGLEAVEKGLEENPALILLDLMLPKMDGLQVCKIMKANPKTTHIPILMLTAKKDEASKIRSLELGASEYLLKPIIPADIVRKVREYLGDKNPPPSSYTVPLIPFIFWRLRLRFRFGYQF
jgi:two-component system alkaline phosphatase synthesis response regulator PhoP